LIASTTINGIDVELILIEPDWSLPVTVEMNIPVDADEGDTGKEERVPESLHPRFSMSYQPDWLATDSEDILTLKATLGTKRVAIPIFPDTQSSISDDFIFAGAHYVSWNDAGSYAIDTDTYDHCAPLAFGYLDDNSYAALTETIGQTQLRFVEDCPFSHRLNVVSVATTNTFTLEPDWLTPVSETLVSPIKRRSIGQGREAQLENQENVFRYEFSGSFKLMTQAELGYLLSFWYQKKGRLHPFYVPAWFQPASSTPETPDTFRARFKGEKLTLSFVHPYVATALIGFVQMPWELNDSGIEHVTDRLFEDSTQWTGLDDGNVSVQADIAGQPHRCVRIAPDASVDKEVKTLQIDAEEDDYFIFSALLSEDGSLSNDMDLRIRAYDSGDSLIGASTPITFTEATTPSSQQATYTCPATTSYVVCSLRLITDGTTGGFAYFGDPSVMQWKSGAEILAERPIQAPKCYSFDFAFDVPGKSNQRFVDWERSISYSGNTFSPYKMTVESMKMGTRLFSEEAKLAYSHESDNPLMEFVLGGMERLVTLTILEGNPERPDTFTTVFVGKLKGLSGSGRSLTATFTAFGGAFDKRLPGFKIQSKCNYILGDANCKVNLASLEATATCDSGDLSDGNHKILCASMSGTLTTINDPNSDPGDRFAGGYLTVGTDDNYQIRFIRKTEIGTGSDRTFTLNRPLDPTKLDASDGAVSVFPGCGGAAWECSGFWSNYVNFGGHPFVPEQLDTVQGQTPSTGK
jgi:hypothetical protein